MSFGNIMHLSYWFAPPYPAYHVVRTVWFALFAVVTLVGLIALIIRTRIAENTLRVVLGRMSALGITMGLVGLLFFTFRQEGIALFSWRIWMLVWWVGLIIWLFKIVRYALSRVPQIRTENRAREMRERYLPKPKK